MAGSNIEHQIDLRILRDIIKIARQLNLSSGDEESLDLEAKIKLIGKLAALSAVGGIKDPAIRLRVLPIIRGM